MALDPPAAGRRDLMSRLMEAMEDHRAGIRDAPVAPSVERDELRARVEAIGFEEPAGAESVLADSLSLLEEAAVHTTHPRYFGLFNPTPTFAGVLADTAVAALNPQLAVWSHAPAAVEIERRLIRYFGERAGFDPAAVAGSFTSGGAEANLTAVLVALTRAFPDYAEGGLRALPGQPVLYASTESHLAWLKIAHACGLGRDAVRLIAHDGELRLDPAALADRIGADRAAGDLPFLAVATVGTTGSGAIDPVDAVADVCEERGVDLHVDAAWAGALVLSERLAPLLGGLHRAASLTIDAHKWLSVPMGAGMFINTSARDLAATFRVQTSYMPSDEADDPYLHSAQWSRRHIGFKLFLSLATIGRSGYAAQLEHDVALGDELRARVRDDGWRVVNDTPLPVVCFAHSDVDAAAVVERVVARGRAWISTVDVNGTPAVRACITSHRTTSADLDVLLSELGAARRELA